MRSYQELEVWKSAMDLVLQVYHLTEPLPPTETYGLRAQMRRAALSIPSNIAEGWGSGARRRYVHMLKVARGSLMELETQGILAARLGYISPEALEDLLETTRHITRMLNRLIHVLARP
jgi:four helix bundle protein